MENRIKALYIITILAILAFLGMQVYWLYGRYEYTLTEAEARAFTAVVETLDEYREQSPGGNSSVTVSRQSNYNLDHVSDSTGRKFTRATIMTQEYRAHDLLGIKEQRKLTTEEMNRAAKLVIDSIIDIEPKKMVYEVANAPSDAAVWGAFNHIGINIDVAEIDSLLRDEGLTPRVTVTQSDSSLWAPSVVRHARAFSPSAEILYPFSELDCKNITVTCRFPITELLGNMLNSLIAVAILSTFLIVCLLLQFSTVLKLSRLDRMRNGFVTTMIHELKRPLSTLKMCISGLDNPRMMADEGTRRELIADSREALDTLSGYFSKLRDITFNNVAQIPLNISTIDLRALAERVKKSAQIPSHKQVGILIDVPEGLTVEADPSHLYNILGNLVENAIKYSGASVKVTISVSELPDGTSVSVSDDGIGIAASDIGRIFDRFYRGRASAGDVPGIGLGLTYVKLLTDAHGVSVRVESAPGSGTCFTITLPR